MRTVLLSLLVAAGPAAAQTISLSPAVVQLRGEPGQSTTQVLTLTNASSIDLEFLVEAKDVVVRDGKRSFVNPGLVPSGIAATAVFSRGRVLVPAGQKQSVSVLLTLPPRTSTRAVVVFFRGKTRIDAGRAASTVSLGTLLTFALGGRVSVAASNLAATPQSATANAAMVESLENDGSEPLVAKGLAVVLDSKGAIVGKAPFQPSRLLPGEKSAFRAEYAGELRKGTYRVLATFEYEGGSVTRTAPLVVR
jgi:hypothetical protein